MLVSISEKSWLMGNGFVLTTCEQRARASDSRMRTIVRIPARGALCLMNWHNGAPHTDEQRGDRNPQRETLP